MAKKKTKKKSKTTKKKVSKKKTAKKSAKKTTKKSAAKKTKKAAKKTLSALSEAEIKDDLLASILSLNEDHSLEDIFKAIRQSDFFGQNSDECLEKNCDNPASTGEFCRFHYIKNWKDVKKKAKILSEGGLQKLIQSLVEKHPLKFVETILDDLVDEKSFFAVLEEMDIDASDESFDDVDENSDDDQDIAFETKANNKVFDE